MPVIKEDLERQLRRQSIWLKDSWGWVLKEKILKSESAGAGRLSALEVGCGPGFVMEIMKQFADVKGVDIDDDMVSACKSRGFDVSKGNAESLPFEDRSFDVSYCSFLLLWVKDPVKVASEMKRVSSRWIICLAEPDFGARIDYPDALSEISKRIIDGIKKDGGDPFIGRKLRMIFSRCGLKAEIGIHPGVWDIDKLRIEMEDEWRFINMTAVSDNGIPEKLKRSWMKSLEDGSLFQFNPIFYAIAEK